MININDYSILINTTDSFEDCWVPFFTLFKKYWPSFNGTIYLNTETKIFTFNELTIVSVRNSLKTPNYRPTWSECLLSALDVIPNDIILYLQEDYFFHDFVKSDLINEFVSLINGADIDCIHLTDQATPGPFHNTCYKQLLKIDKNAHYRISTQAALWKKDVLKQYIRIHENAWQFEQYATKRAGILNHKFYNVDTSIYIKGQNEIIPYVFTGIIRGYWLDEVAELFRKNNIQMDFQKRGFIKFAKPRSLIYRIVRKIVTFPSEIRSRLDIIGLLSKDC